MQLSLNKKWSLGTIFLIVPKAGLEPALLSEKHFECSASAISPLRLT